MQLLSVLLGGIITLVVTAVVQIFVIPAVQRRTRALERWEKDVIELMTLVNEEMNDKLATLKNVCQDDLPEALIMAAATAKEHPDSDEPVLIVSKAWGYAEKSWDEAHELSNKIMKTLRRCALVNRRSPFWSILFNEVQGFRSALVSCTRRRTTPGPLITSASVLRRRLCLMPTTGCRSGFR